MTNWVERVKNKKSDLFFWITVGMIFILGISLRFYALGTKSMWDDEVFTVQIAKSPLLQIWQDLSIKTNSPPLYYWLLHLSMSGNENEFTARLLSAVFGVLTLGGFYWCGKNLMGRRSAIFALCLMAVSPFYIYYSQEVRMYSLWTFMLILSYYFLIINLNERPNNLNYLLYLVTTVLAVYTHYFTAFHLVAQVLIVSFAFVFSHNKKSVRWLFFLFIWGIIGLAAFPVVQLSSQGLPRGTGTPLSQWTMELIIQKLSLIWQIFLALPEYPYTLLACFMSVLFTFGVYVGLRKQFTTNLYLLIWIIVPTSLGIFFLEGRSFFHVRYFLPVTVPFLLFAGEGLG